MPMPARKAVPSKNAGIFPCRNAPSDPAAPLSPPPSTGANAHLRPRNAPDKIPQKKDNFGPERALRFRLETDKR